jgi:phospholipase A-2-activating protein
MFNKIATINKNMVSSGRKDAALNPGEEQALKALQEALSTSKTPPPHSTELIVRVVTEWPYTDRLAGLDALRCMAKYRVVAQYSAAEYPSLIHLAIAASLPAEETPNENAVMMGARTIANIFATADGRSAASSHTDAALAFLERVTGTQGAEAIGKHNRNVLIALSTVALNFSVLVARENLLTPQQRRRLFIVFGAIMADQTDSEVLYRTLVGLGTLLMASPELALGSDVKARVQAASDSGSEDRVKQVAADVAKVIRS